MIAKVLATFAEIHRALSASANPKAPVREFAENALHVFDGHQRPVVAALLTIAVCIREGRLNV